MLFFQAAIAHQTAAEQIVVFGECCAGLRHSEALLELGRVEKLGEKDRPEALGGRRCGACVGRDSECLLDLDASVADVLQTVVRLAFEAAPTRRLTPSGTSFGSSPQSGVALRMRVSTSAAVLPRNGRRPVRHS